MAVRVKIRKYSYAVLIPSKGRPEVLLKTLRAQPFLNRPSTFIGLEQKELKAYRKVRDEFWKISYVLYDNPVKSGTLARELLRQSATEKKFDRYVLSDDKKRSAMFWAIPHSLYSTMKYTVDEGCMDDVQVTFAGYDHGITALVVCMDAPFQKKRYSPGGYGGIGERVRKVGIAIQRFAKTHPQYMEKVRVTFPWTQIEKKVKESKAK
jgi:hypothetical protein